VQYFTITDTSKGSKEYWNEFGTNFGFSPDFKKSIKVLSPANATKELKRVKQWANGKRNLTIEPHDSNLTNPKPSVLS